MAGGCGARASDPSNGCIDRAWRGFGIDPSQCRAANRLWGRPAYLAAHGGHRAGAGRAGGRSRHTRVHERGPRRREGLHAVVIDTSQVPGAKGEVLERHESVVRPALVGAQAHARAASGRGARPPALCNALERSSALSHAGSLKRHPTSVSRAPTQAVAHKAAARRAFETGRDAGCGTGAFRANGGHATSAGAGA